MFERETVRNGDIRQRLANADQPTHPLRQQLQATRRPNRRTRLKTLIINIFRDSRATA